MKIQTQQPLETITEMKEVNGKQIPIITHTPINNGEVANNTEIKDMSPKIETAFGSLSCDEQMSIIKKVHDSYSENSVVVRATITKKEVFQGKEIFDKGGNPILDSSGIQRRYPDRFLVGISGDGYSTDFYCTEAFYNSLELKGEYLLFGYNITVQEFGSSSFSPSFTRSQDFTIPAPSADDLRPENYVAYYKRVREHEKTNLNVLCATVLEKNIIHGKEIFDKHTNMPRLTQGGDPMRYPDKYSLVLIGEGFMTSIECSLELFNSVEADGTRYRFAGSNGDIMKYGEKKFSAIYASVSPAIAPLF